MQDTTPATLPRFRGRSAFGCSTTQPWHKPEGSCRDGLSRLARLHTFYPARASGPEPVNVYGAGKVLGCNRGSRGSVLARHKFTSAEVATASLSSVFPRQLKQAALSRAIW
jgi:hypothetical protein